MAVTAAWTLEPFSAIGEDVEVVVPIHGPGTLDDVQSLVHLAVGLPHLKHNLTCHIYIILRNCNILGLIDIETQTKIIMYLIYLMPNQPYQNYNILKH